MSNSRSTLVAWLLIYVFFGSTHLCTRGLSEGDGHNLLHFESHFILNPNIQLLQYQYVLYPLQPTPTPINSRKRWSQVHRHTRDLNSDLRYIHIVIIFVLVCEHTQPSMWLTRLVVACMYNILRLFRRPLPRGKKYQRGSKCSVADA